MQEKQFWMGVRDGLPTALGYISIGVACGIVAAPYLSPVEMSLMSLIVYAGSAQFVMISMFALHQDITSITLTVFLINIRFLLMSLHTSTSFRTANLWHNVGIGSILTDESYGVFLNKRGKQDAISPWWMHGNNLLGYLVWNVSTVAGVLLGALLPNPERFGMDFALIAMFVGIFADQFMGMQALGLGKKVALVLGAVSLSFFFLMPFLSQSLTVLVSTLVGCVVGVIIDDSK
ncbi:AzlC family ABC transporter permease [Streptococcus sp. DD13]|uniref:AzlC family ABC transporter permease n=1 Tax=Streptococcus sp. DD13 TaxID=1777881 RepID=UPI00082A6F8E|nr:AzlC family ABC transporter permease [Streptococcus sp. DD13]